MGGKQRNYFYAVQKGKQQGVFSTWDECKSNVNGYSGAKYKKFNTMEEAQAFVNQSTTTTTTTTTSSFSPSSTNNHYSDDYLPLSCSPSTNNSYNSYYPKHSPSYTTPSTHSQNATSTPSHPTSNYNQHSPPATLTSNSRLKANYQPRNNVHDTSSSSSSSSSSNNHILSASTGMKRKLSADGDDDHDFQRSRSSSSNTTNGHANNSVVYSKAKIIKTEGNVKPMIIKTEEKTGLEGEVAKGQVVYTDGASRGNGLKGAKAGYGIWWGDGDPRNTCGPLDGQLQTNQRAEATAILKVLEQTQQMGEQLEIHTDSQYCIKAMTEWHQKWQDNDWKSSTGKDVQNKDLFEPMLKLMRSRKGETKFVYVPGHTGIYGNEQADALAVAGAQAPRVKKEVNGVKIKKEG